MTRHAKPCLVIKTSETSVKGFAYSSRQVDISCLRDFLVVNKLTTCA